MKIGKDRRSGVALVIVLGLVAVLLIMCVAFSINMRVERAGAANLRHAAMARQLAKGAMAVAIQRIDDDLVYHDGVGWYSDEPGADVYVRVFTNRNTGASARKNLWNGTFVSYNDVGRIGRSEEHIPASFFTPEVDRYFPSGLAFKGYAAKYRTGSGHNVQTKDIFQPEWVPVYSGGGNLIGRYSFFAMETTGLLDISVASHTNRWMGYDPGEIALSDDILDGELILPSGKKIDDIVKDLDSDSRYESFAEFRALRENNSDKTKNYFSNLRSLTTFSYAPSETNDSSKVMIGQKAGETYEQYLKRLREDDKTKIIEAFEKCGLTAGANIDVAGKTFKEQAVWAYLGLIDFVDDDDEMEVEDDIKIKDGTVYRTLYPWERPATENMPLPSGFIANLVVKCDEIPEYDENGELIGMMNNKFIMKIEADFKIPFVCPFITQQLSSSFDLFGKVALSRDPTDEGSLHELLMPDDIIVKTPDKPITTRDVDDNSITDINISCPEAEVVANRRGANLPPSIFEFSTMYLHAAAATVPSGGDVLDDCQRRYPVHPDDYDADDNPWTWMTVSVNFEDYNIDLPDQPSKPPEIPDPTKPEIIRRTWSTNIVVWAEILDPRFSSSVMRDNTDWDDPLFYRPSHMLSKLVEPSQHTTVPVTQLKDSVDEFKDFNVGEISEDDFYKDDYYGGYFDDGSSANSGASPLASYVLTHPCVASDVYMINIDGCRIDSSEDENTTDIAPMKWRAYVKNQPLESVGELGYLPIGIWQTIRLYDYNNIGEIAPDDKYKPMVRYNYLPSDLAIGPPFHPVLDKFIVRDDAVKGRVNLNTISGSVLASVFYDLPIFTPGDPYFPNQSTGDDYNPNYRVRPDDAKYLAEAIMAERSAAGGTLTSITNLCNIFRWGSGVFLNGGEDMSDAAIAAANAASPTGAQDSFGEFEREAIIRNSCGLFTTRGQSFIIVARGESYSPIFGRTTVEGGTVNAARTAIAQIWRDTEKDADGKYPIAIQFFKIIDD